jgi:RND family efflux transporter MFP subunit
VAREVPDEEDFTGRTEAVSRVDLRARVSGFLLKADFREGDSVKEGDQLFEIDPRPYQAELQKAHAAVGLAEARLRLADANSRRAVALSKTKAISQEEVDRAAAERAEAEAVLVAAKAALEPARLNIEFTHILAPISGRIGRRLLDPGNFVKADDALLATIVSEGPIYVFCDCDERTALRLMRAMGERKGAAEKPPVRIGLAGEEGFPHAGVLDFIDNRVNTETGTLRLRAVVPNKDGLMIPGMFVRIRLKLGEPYKVFLVPTRAVMSEHGEPFVYVVNDRDVIEKRPVTLGQDRGNRRVVNKGLKAEDRVVVGQLEELRPGMAVRPREGDAAPPSPPPADTRRPGPAPMVLGRPGPVLFVEAAYPGANAAVVADTVAAPIEQQINGVEGLMSLRSRSTSDGRCSIAVAFRRGTDPKFNMVFVQNRANIAEPVLPEMVKKTGVTIRDRSPGVVLLASLFSPEARFSNLYLSNYATLHIRDELRRLPGVSEVALLGQQDYVLRVWLDPEKLAAHGLDAVEVARKIEKANGNDAVRPGKPADSDERSTILVFPPRLADPDKLPELVVKSAGDVAVRLKDVASIELGAGGPESHASLDGQPAIALAIHPTHDGKPDRVVAAVREKLSQLRADFPAGIDYLTLFDSTKDLGEPGSPSTGRVLLFDVDLPPGASLARKEESLRRCSDVLRGMPQVAHVLSLTECPFDLFPGGPCLVAVLAPEATGKVDREAVLRKLRQELTPRARTRIRLRDPGASGHPINLAISGPDPFAVREMAQKLAQRLSREKALLDVWIDPASVPRPEVQVDVDRPKMTDLGLSSEDVFASLQLLAGSLHVNDFNRFGRTWRIEVQTQRGAGDLVEDIRKLKVRNRKGDMVPLATVVTIRSSDAPAAIDLLEMRPMVEITANRAAGTSAAEVRTLIETASEEVRRELRLPAQYRLTWLHEVSWKD